MKKLINVRLLSIRNGTADLIRHSPRKFAYRLTFILFSIAGIYFAIYGGLHFIVSLGGLGSVIIKKVIFILFFILFFMVGVSFGVLFYGTAFKSREALFLFTLPINRGRIMAYKFTEAAFFASWIPFIGLVFFYLAYSNVGKVNASWIPGIYGANFSLALVTPLFTIPFLVISCSFGYVLTLIVARYLNFRIIFFITGIVLFLTFIYYFKYIKPSQQKGILFLLSEEVALLKYSKLWFLPFSWPAYGLVAFEDGDLKKCFLYLINLWSLALLCLAYVSRPMKTFLSVYHQQTTMAQKQSRGVDYLRVIFSGLPSYLRAFAVKDIKLFVREPSLWLQFLIFFGILFFYFINLRKFSYHLLDPMWKNLLTFLNSFSILCIISAMSIRFVFPQWSLEGRSFWILKLSPLTLKKVFLEKLLLAGGILSIISIALIYISNHMLNISAFFSMLTIFIILVSTVTMVSISLGLGGYFANFREEYYLKSVESLGGFVAIILTFGYTILTVILFLGISHFYFTDRLPQFMSILPIVLTFWCIFSITASIVSLWLGMRKLNRMEY